MRKVLIGCGVLVLLALGFAGYVGYRLWPSVTALHQAWSDAMAELDALDERHPFDPAAQSELDAGRFDLMLDVRVHLADYFAEVDASLDDIKRKGEAEDGPGAIAQSSRMIEVMTPTVHEFAVRLEDARMGPTEFSRHTRVLWAALSRVDAGVAGPELEPLRGEFGRFRELYDQQARRQEQMRPLDEIVRSVPADQLVQAAEVLARDPERVQRGLAFTEFDFLYLQHPGSVDELMEAASSPSP
jgi:hypothetical protein